MIRTAIQRTAPDTRPKPAKGPRTVKCKHRGCLHRFVPDPERPLVTWCSLECAVLIAVAAGAARKAKIARNDRVSKRAERVADKAKIDKTKSIGELKAEAQVPFNQWVRLRDELAGEPCICCDRMPTSAEALTGGAWDAAHYRSRGSADHLRFDERNVHRSLKHCNTYGHRDYRGGLIRRIGQAAVEALEAEQTVVKWSADYLIWVKAEYAARVRALLKGIARPHQTYHPTES